MKQFLYLFRGGDENYGNLSPEEFQAHMERWGTWMAEVKAEGFPLEGTGMLVSGTAAVVSNGPFAEGAEVVGGYVILPAKDMDEAVELSKGCPILEMNGNIEVRPVANLPE